MVYVIGGEFYSGMTWEDFICSSGDGPDVTIRSKDNYLLEPVLYDMLCGKEEFVIVGEDKDGWYDAVAKVLNKSIAKKILGKINGCSPAHINIIEERNCISV
ncbi:MAG: hypothetical protein HYW78_03750 [Parcubacteria group bacterium]|nr:hypothetical protein [Parcubacteria group bacterium]